MHSSECCHYVHVFVPVEIKSSTCHILNNSYTEVIHTNTLQLERAGETYRRLRRPVDGSRLYEQLGKFNMAVETLYENDLYDMAIDTLRRYTMMIEVITEYAALIIIPPDKQDV